MVTGVTKKDHKGYFHQSIRLKIFLVSLLPTVALLYAAFLNNQYLGDLGDSAELILSKNYKSSQAAQEVRKSLEDIRNRMLDQLSKQKQALEIPPETLDKLFLNLMVCKKNVTETGEAERIDNLMVLYRSYETAIHSVVQNASGLWYSGPFSDFLGLTAEMIVLTDDLVAINEDAMEIAEKHPRTSADQAQRNAALLFGVIIFAILLLSYFLSYRVAMPLMELARQLSHTLEGSGVYPSINLKSKDESGLLADSFNQLFNRLEQYDNHRDDIILAEREKVRRNEEAKGTFIADISHQLKTPVTSLGMGIGMLYNRGDMLSDEKKKKLYATAYDDCMRLTALINKLVDLSRLEALALPRPKETLDIAMVIKECLPPLYKEAENKGISVELDIPGDLPRMTIDSFRFPWVITNLVGNAMRYTGPGGKISLKVYEQGTRYYFQCSDTGDGIDPKVLPHIFDRFTQFSDRGKSGTIGLGLAIVKDVIEQHGGDIKVQSELGKGTSFIFWIPAEKEEIDEKSPDY